MVCEASLVDISARSGREIYKVPCAGGGGQQVQQQADDNIPQPQQPQRQIELRIPSKVLRLHFRDPIYGFFAVQEDKTIPKFYEQKKTLAKFKSDENTSFVNLNDNLNGGVRGTVMRIKFDGRFGEKIVWDHYPVLRAMLGK